MRVKRSYICLIIVVLFRFMCGFCTFAQQFKVWDVEPWEYSNESGFVYIAERNDSLFKILSKNSEPNCNHGIRPGDICEFELECEMSPFNRGRVKTMPGMIIRGYNNIKIDSRFHESVYIAKKVHFIEDSAMQEMHSFLYKQDSFLINKRDSSIYYHFKGETCVKIPQGVRHIDSYVFSGDTLISTVCIPESVVSIGDYAFENCWNIKSVSMSGSIKTIGANAFYCCFKLSDITMPCDIETIGWRCFYHCSNLREIVLPYNLIEITDEAFLNCNNLWTIRNYSKFIKLKKGSEDNGCVAKYAKKIKNRRLFSHFFSAK